MKLLYFANVRIPTEKAHGAQVMSMCEAFADQGYEVELIIPRRLNPEFKGVDPFSFYGVKNNFKIKKIVSLDPHWLVYLPQGTYIKFQLAFFLISLFFHLLSRGSDKKNAIFYTRDEYLLPLLNRFSYKVVWEAHNLPRRKKSYVKYWRWCHKIFTLTNGLKNELVGLGVPAQKIFIAPDAVKIEDFDIALSKTEAREKLTLPVDKTIVMYTGHLYQWKGAEILARAAQFLSGRYLVVFVGGTDFDLKRFKVAVAGYKNILIVGQRPHQQIPRYLKAADIVVLPNSGTSDISKWYTSPIKLFEYMAAKRPIVASDLPSIREVLNPKNSILVEPDNPQALAQAIGGILQNKALFDIIVEQSFKDVQQYTWAQRAQKIISAI